MKLATATGATHCSQGQGEHCTKDHATKVLAKIALTLDEAKLRGASVNIIGRCLAASAHDGRPRRLLVTDSGRSSR